MKYLLLVLVCLVGFPVNGQEAQPKNDVVLAVPDADHPWASAQIGAVLADDVVYSKAHCSKRREPGL